MLTCLLWQLASVFLPQLDQGAALCSHNSGIKAQRIKCCVTLRKGNSVIMRARAQLCVCVRGRARPRAPVWGLICVYVSVGSSNLIAVLLLQQDGNKECACLRVKQKGREKGDTEREGEQVRECVRQREREVLD